MKQTAEDGVLERALARRVRCAAAHAQHSLRRRAAGVTVDRARGAAGHVIHLVNRPCE